MGKKLHIFLRDDDIYSYDHNFLSTFNLLKSYKIPVILGVIPEKIERKLVNFLNKEKKNNNYQFDIAQHGWSHKNYSKDIKNKYEFGPLRNYQQQKKDITKGYIKMKQLFGKNFTPAFIPPYHGYDDNTLKIINELKIPLFSAGEKIALKKGKFLDLPAQLSLNDYGPKGKPIQLTAKTLIKRFYFSINRYKILGMVFHHYVIKNKKQIKQFETFVKFLAKSQKEEIIKITIFDQIYLKDFL
ncbi:MAG: DUF2334 domain-containing protein [Candidatus Omnitrophica bacterium]|nr:DUF2334 domain-containing protein [Candidatus Omnitrophota bacterium]